ncbi:MULTISPECIES: phenylacetate--CoA ligase family protein [Cytobacillus]|uniref:Phenylacetate-coenzyme A ligase n=2 Tax=Cytobacillus oceanisediminis TaxID=665099 RepID=A0A160MAM4_9BACI|nr:MULTISPECIES: AMP-binding protein [Cytobacillus]MBY0159657.1 AMP-binding protein [Cytobacillus firmus]AND39837.1 phenylacetate--CoA ligase [Cytobacillus oceanisediminis 2691]MBU8772876.1 AMP-binding protein [Cytobacillus oceanisediminis]MCM3246032.1 AMP-binding protein [Cytobacillus oceanisediminis]MCM3405277.1 AMP-binding protein [Cytobacillus oceanisediminis]
MILHDIETESRDFIEQLQLDRLKQTVERVFNHVPFYRKKFLESNIAPEDVNSLNDIQKLPFTVKADLREHYPFGLFAVDKKEIVRLHASSGTSGKPTVVGYTRNDIKMWSNLIARAISIGGGEPGQTLHNAYGYGLFTGGLGLHYGSEQLGMATVPVSGGNTDRQIMLIQDFKPEVICGTPSYILNLAEKMEERGMDPADTSLKYGIFGAEPWSEEMRKTLEAKLGIKACDIYGLSEVLGPGVAMECHESQDGLHIAEDHFYAEVIDPKKMTPLPNGEEGELVFTSLTKEAFPVIRYRTGDIASLSKEKCVCGRTTLRMSRVKGRIDDMLNVNGVNVFPSEIERCILQMPELSPHYHIQVYNKGSLKVLELHAEWSEEFYRDMGEAEHVKKKIKEAVKQNCFITIGLVLHPPKTLPRSDGKAVRIVNPAVENAVT